MTNKYACSCRFNEQVNNFSLFPKDLISFFISMLFFYFFQFSIIVHQTVLYVAMYIGFVEYLLCSDSLLHVVFPFLSFCFFRAEFSTSFPSPRSLFFGSILVYVLLSLCSKMEVIIFFSSSVVGDFYFYEEVIEFL